MAAPGRALVSLERGPSLRPALVFFVFLLAGPPLGLLTLLVSAVVASAVTSGISSSSGAAYSAAISTEGISKTILFFGLMSYMFGIAQATIVGAVASIFQMTNPRGRLRLVPALVASIIVAILYLAFLALKTGTVLDLMNVSLAFLIHIGAAVLCWALANLLLWFGKAAQASASISPVRTE